MLAKRINLNDAQIIVLPNWQVAYSQFQPEVDFDDEFEMEQDSDVIILNLSSNANVHQISLN